MTPEAALYRIFWLVAGGVLAAGVVAVVIVYAIIWAIDADREIPEGP